MHLMILLSPSRNSPLAARSIMVLEWKGIIRSVHRSRQQQGNVNLNAVSFQCRSESRLIEAHRGIRAEQRDSSSRADLMRMAMFPLNHVGAYMSGFKGFCY